MKQMMLIIFIQKLQKVNMLKCRLSVIVNQAHT